MSGLEAWGPVVFGLVGFAAVIGVVVWIWCSELGRPLPPYEPEPLEHGHDER